METRKHTTARVRYYDQSKYGYYPGSLSPSTRNIDHSKLSGIAADINMASNPIQDASGAPGGIERRKHSRHRLIVDLNISSENGATMHGMSFEIGAGDMSAATSGPLEVGEQVILYPVIRARVGKKFGVMPNLAAFPNHGRHLKATSP